MTDCSDWSRFPYYPSQQEKSVFDFIFFQDRRSLWFDRLKLATIVARILLNIGSTFHNNWEYGVLNATTSQCSHFPSHWWNIGAAHWYWWKCIGSTALEHENIIAAAYTIEALLLVWWFFRLLYTLLARGPPPVAIPDSPPVHSPGRPSTEMRASSEQERSAPLLRSSVTDAPAAAAAAHSSSMQGEHSEGDVSRQMDILDVHRLDRANAVAEFINNVLCSGVFVLTDVCLVCDADGGQ